MAENNKERDSMNGLNQLRTVRAMATCLLCPILSSRALQKLNDGNENKKVRHHFCCSMLTRKFDASLVDKLLKLGY